MTLARAFAFFIAGTAFLLPILGLRSDGIVAHLISMGKVTGIRPVLTLCALASTYLETISYHSHLASTYR